VKRVVAGLALALLVGCGAEEPERSATPTASAPTAGPPTASAAPRALDFAAAEVLVTGLEVPWGLDFLPDGNALVTERESGRVLRVPPAGGEPSEVTVIEQTAARGEGGLLGLALSPSFEQDRLVYVYVTTEQDNRVLRFPLDDPDRIEPVLTGIPAGILHNGGRLAFGPAGQLYIGTGDAGEPARAQDPGSLGGKVLRVTPDGDPVAGQDSQVFSLGHRNVQGLAFGADGQVYAVEFGQNRFDEVNAIEQGSNGGWPVVEGPGDGDGRFLDPITVWDPAEASPSGAGIVGDALYVAALRGERLWRVPLADPSSPEPLLEGEYGRLRTAQRAPDGSLWLLTSNRDGRGDPERSDDRIVRVPPG
jgi:glucose/arabinose dehydrogenase